MAGNLSPADVRSALLSSEPLSDPFGILRSIGTHLSFAKGPSDARVARDLVILMLDRRGELNGYSEVLDSLAVAAGLYPYAAPDALNTAQLIEYEAHRPFGLDDTVFHQVQATVYNALMDGDSVVLSAPTSFGKSLIIDALVASGDFRNVAIVVPTIALIDETRRRLAQQFRQKYKIITHPAQQPSERNLLVMTQERILDVEDLPQLDLFVIDEFYKLDPAIDADRANLLNQAFYRLRRTGARFYLLGPSIEGTPVQLNDLARVVVTDFSTVSLDVRRVNARRGSELETLVGLCSGLSDPTLIYCKSPAQARDVARTLAGAGVAPAAEDLAEAAQWIGDKYHHGWSFVEALSKGIGIHHGRIPRSLGQLAVRAFNAGSLRFLVCTSTLIEGVNTTAKNVVVYENKIANERIDFFTFNNIKGRSGRMFSHFVGHVYLFHEPPSEVLRSVDVPVLTQPSTAAKSLLIQLAEGDLSAASRAALAGLLDQEELSVDDMRKSAGVEPDQLLQLARRLHGEPSLRRALAWSGYPSYENLTTTCSVLWDDLGGQRFRSSYVRSAAQLSFRLRHLRSDNIGGLIRTAIDETGDPDSAVEEVLYFIRQWANFHFPKLLMAAQRVQNRVASDLGERPAAYEFYAAQVESLFRPRTLMVLEEYGIPLQIAETLHRAIDLDVSLDEALSKIRSLDFDSIPLLHFERQLLDDARQYI